MRLSWIFILFVSTQLIGQGLALQWAVGSQGNYLSAGTDIFCEPSTGDVLIVGRLNGTADFDPGPGTFFMTSTGHPYVLRLNSSGQLIWAKQFLATTSPTISTSFCNRVSTDNAGNVFVAGNFDYITDFDPGVGTFTLDPLLGALFVVKLTSSGNFLWAKQFGPSSAPNAIPSAYHTLDQAGDILLSGHFKGTGDFDPGAGSYSMSSVAGSNDIYLLKLSNGGNFLWAQQFGDQGNDGCNMETAVDGTNNIFLSGQFTNVIDLDGGPGTFIVSAANGDRFVSKIDATGNFIFGKQLGVLTSSTSYVAPKRIKLDIWNNIYMTGNYSGVGNFAPFPSSYTVAAQGPTDGFLLSLKPSGAIKWVKTFGGNSSSATGADIAFDSAKVYLGGYFNLNVDFDPTPATYSLASYGSFDGFISRYDTAGSFSWVRRIGGSSVELLSAIDTHTSKAVYATGQYKATCDFDPSPAVYTLQTQATNSESFFAKYIRCKPPLAPTLTVNQPTICESLPFTLQTVNSGTTTIIHWSNYNAGNMYLGSGTTFVVPALTPGSYTFYALQEDNCSESAYAGPAMVTVYANPPVTAAADKTLICVGEPVVLSASGALTYTWNNILAANSVTVNPFISTVYTVVGSSINDCKTTALVSINVKSCPTVTAGIEEFEQEANSVYPNPSEGNITVRTAGECNLAVFDVTGRQVQSAYLREKGSIQLNCANGVYLFQFRYSGGKTRTQKVVIQ